MDTDVWHLGCLDQHLCPVTSWEEEPHVRVGSVIYVLICICRLMAGTCDSNPLSKSKCRTWDWAQCVPSQPSLALQKGAQGWDLRPPTEEGACAYLCERRRSAGQVPFHSWPLCLTFCIFKVKYIAICIVSPHLVLSICDFQTVLSWNCFGMKLLWAEDVLQKFLLSFTVALSVYILWGLHINLLFTVYLCFLLCNESYLINIMSLCF